ncbi:MAG: thermonuclease family protein [Cyanobacteria bacterium P01_H01_bin.58]
MRKLGTRGIAPLLAVGAISLATQLIPREWIRSVASSDSPSGEFWTVVPGSIYDGDTLQVQQGSTVEKIRLCGIDAPEKAQPLGIEARDRLAQLLEAGELIVEPVERDRYGRLVAELWTADTHINSHLVADGMAYHYAQYSDSCPNKVALA